MNKSESRPHSAAGLPKEGYGTLTEAQFQTFRQQFFKDHAVSVLTIIHVDGNLNMLEVNPRESRLGPLTGRVSLDTVIGLNPEDDKPTKNRKAKEIFSNEFSQNIDRFWNPDPELEIDPTDRKISEICRKLRQKGYEKETIKMSLIRRYALKKD